MSHVFAGTTQYLGISTKNNYKDGVMQDVHWPAGTYGYFPAYTLGRLMASQFFANATQEYSSITKNLSQGNFKQLKQWLNTHVHALASSVSNEQLLKINTKEPLNPAYFIRHIKERYALENSIRL